MAQVRTATVVGAGPNGLVAAALLARAGLDVTVLEGADQVGGGARSAHPTLPGLVHDHCAAVHPMAVGSPVLERLDLARFGVRWRLPDVDCAHPLDGGDAGVLYRSVEQTAVGLGADGRLWRLLFGAPSRGYDVLAEDILGPLLRVPAHPLRLLRFGAPTVLPATALARGLRTERARALFLGVAAHAFTPLHRPLSSAIGLGILTAGHRHGWAVVAGGTGALTDALVAVLGAHGAKITTGHPVRAAADLPPSDVTIWDVGPDQLPGLLGDRLPGRVSRAYRRFRYGPGVFKLDLAVRGGIPWTSADARRAGTVHAIGSAAEVVAAERLVHSGRLPRRPFVLVGQQYLADPDRSDGEVHPVYAYAHVPRGHTGDVTEAMLDQIERFAPGFRARILAAAASTPDMFAQNPNFVGGNILTGAMDTRQLLFGPRTTLRPYDTGAAGHFLCSAATPPGPGVHGMCGAGAADRALAYLNL